MNEKIINVFFGVDCLPYKDVERQVHFPITGSAFLGASNTTKIRFYFDQIGNSNVTWVAVAKLPNGKQGSKVLSVSEDSELGENYAELQLDSWYTQAKGDVYIALQGYQGGVEYSYDSETELYEITGTPTIQTTGSIKLAINYAPIGQVADYTDEFTTYQEILAGLGDKADITSTIIVVNDITQVVATTYEDGQVFYNLADRKLYQLDNSSFVVFQPYVAISSEPIPQSDLDIILAHKEYPILYGSYVFWYYGEDTLALRYARNDLDVSSNTFTTTKQQLIIFKNTREYDLFTQNAETYKKSKIDTELSGKADKSTTYTKTETDILLNAKQDTLVSGTNIKSLTVDGVEKSLLGSGTIEVGTGSGGGAWGEITGDIQDQTDLQNELQDIREVAEGKSKTLVLSYSQTAPTSDLIATSLRKEDGTRFTDLEDFNAYVSGYTLANSSFNSQDDSILISNYYVITSDYYVLRMPYIYANFKRGDIFLITQTDVPDRWISTPISDRTYFSKLETTKVDLTNYATKTEVNAKSDLSNIAPTYDETVIYSIGDKVIYEGKLYTCTTAIETPETWDSTHWTQVSVASGFVDLDKEQVISGEKTFTNGIKLNQDAQSPEIYWRSDISRLEVGKLSITVNGNDTYSNSNLVPYPNNTRDLGSSSYPWKNLYLSGTATINILVTTQVDASLNPYDDNYRSIGYEQRRWKDGYFAGQVYAQNTFNVINASDIVNNTLTADQLAIITNGKPTLISGTFLTRNNVILYPPAGASPCYGLMVYLYGNRTIVGEYSIDSSNVISENTNAYQKLINLNQVEKINGTNVDNIINGTFNVINASDIENNTLTQAQYDLITNGKPTMIVGTLLGYNNLFVLNMNTYTNGCFGNAICYKSGEEYKTFVLGIQISSSNVISITNTNYYNYCYYNNVASVNGKLLPSYPSSTGTFTLKCVDGVLTWVAD